MIGQQSVEVHTYLWIFLKKINQLSKQCFSSEERLARLVLAVAKSAEAAVAVHGPKQVSFEIPGFLFLFFFRAYKNIKRVL